MKFIVFYLQLINSLEGLGMFFSSAALIDRLSKYTATTYVFTLRKLYLPTEKSLTTKTCYLVLLILLKMHFLTFEI